MSKTNAMRILDSKNIDYEYINYKLPYDQIDGISVADKIDRSYEEVYKTLVTEGSEDYYVFIIPVIEELNLKKAAKLVGEKRIKLVNADKIEDLTGYIRGGCSPIGMKKKFKTYIQKDAKNLEEIIVSGGRIGSQLIMNPLDLIKIVRAKSEDVIK